MLALSCDFDVAVTKGRHTKCVNGGFFAAGGFRWPFGRGIFPDRKFVDVDQVY